MRPNRVMTDFWWEVWAVGRDGLHYFLSASSPFRFISEEKTANNQKRRFQLKQRARKTKDFIDLGYYKLSKVYIKKVMRFKTVKNEMEDY